MRVGITISSFNRHYYLKQCLDSIRLACVPVNAEIIIVDDCSTEPEVKELLSTCDMYIIQNQKRSGICNSLLIGFDYLFLCGCDVVMNLDNDAIVKKDFVKKILSLRKKFPNSIVTGFNTDTKNKNGTSRHNVISYHNGYNLKPSVGGINMCFSIEEYKKYIKPALVKCRNGGNWDNQACISAFADNHPVVVVQPSVIQHIGAISSLNHATGGELPDTSSDF